MNLSQKISARKAEEIEDDYCDIGCLETSQWTLTSGRVKIFTGERVLTALCYKNQTWSPVSKYPPVVETKYPFIVPSIAMCVEKDPLKRNIRPKTHGTQRDFEYSTTDILKTKCSAWFFADSGFLQIILALSLPSAIAKVVREGHKESWPTLDWILGMWSAVKHTN